MRNAKITLIATIAVGLLAGSMVSVAAQDEVAAPVEFTAKWAPGPAIRSGTTEAGDDAVERRGHAWRPGELVAASDPRLTGTLSIATNSDDYGAADGPVVYNYAFRIENVDGAWQQMPVISVASPGGDPASTVAVLVGEGGYEGLVAVMKNDKEGDDWVLHGYIIDGELPPAPEPVIGE